MRPPAQSLWRYPWLPRREPATRLHPPPPPPRAQLASSEAEADDSHVLVLTEATFDAAVEAHGSAAAGEAGGALLVSFTAPWCGHCKHLKPEVRAAVGGWRREGR